LKAYLFYCRLNEGISIFAFLNKKHCMGNRNKLQKFAELLDFPNVFEANDKDSSQLSGEKGTLINLKGKWHDVVFKNNNPITLELACGRGEYSVALGRMFPERNFIGVDIKGARIHQGAKAAITEGLHNVAFLRTRIEMIAKYFDKNEIDEIWITFPDPFLRESKANRRLTSPYFLNQYKSFLKPNALIHLKTDSPVLYNFTLETLRSTEGVSILKQSEDIYANPLEMKELEVKTYYEKKNIAQSSIKYLSFVIK
jgi:tRNA (guanine-N7-)-methyltransferase